MVNRAQSKARKAIVRDLAQNRNLEHAILAFTEDQTASPLSRKGVNKLAKKFKVHETTLRKHTDALGERPPRTRAQYLASRQKVSPAKEKIVLAFVLEMAERGLPLTLDDMRQYATHIVNSGKRQGGVVLGKQWPRNFIDRHHKQLSTHWSSPLDSKRTSSLTPQAVEGHFRCVKETAEKYEIIPENDYGMDESPIILGFSCKKRVISKAKAKQAHSRRDGSRESLTVVETICADGSTLKPTVIFKGKTFGKDWGGPDNNPIEAQICRAEKGYMDGVLSLAWIKYFDEQTREKAAGRYRRLFVDNHSSHCTISFLRYAQSKKIVVVGYPPHCTHALQGLDVVCFARVKVLWGVERDKIEQDDEGKVAKRDFLAVYGRVREKAFTTQLVKSAFRKTGIQPFGPSVIRPEQMAPARTHSTESGAPLPLPTPVRAIRDALRMEIDMPILSPPSQSPPQPIQPFFLTPIPQDPDSEMDYSPPPSPTRRRASAIIHSLQGTVAAPLVSRDLADFSSATPIPALAISPIRPISQPSYTIDPALLIDDSISSASPPDHSATSGPSISAAAPSQEELADRVAYLENKCLTYESQLVLQDLYCSKVQRKLYTKEHKKKTTRQALMDQGKRDMTHAEWIAALEEEASEKDRVVALKAEKKSWRAKEKEERAEGYGMLVDRWREEVVQARAAKRKPPLKPKEPKRCPTPERFAELKKAKAKAKQVVSDEDESEGGSDEDE